MKKLYILILLSLTTTSFFAQIGINTTDPKALLEIKSSSETAPTITDGLLIPKVNVFPATNPTIDQQGMLVYLKNTSGTNQPGFYYWNFGTLAWIRILTGTSGGTLDQAYDFGGVGNGKTITADAGAVLINGTDGFVSTGTVGSGAIAQPFLSVRMFWNPRKGAFRAGIDDIGSWHDANMGNFSAAFGNNTQASGTNSTSFGFLNFASGDNSTAFGNFNQANGANSTAFGNSNQANSNNSTAFGRSNNVSGFVATAFGNFNSAIGLYSTAFGSTNTSFGVLTTTFGRENNAQGEISSVFGYNNASKSIAETVFGIGATNYTQTINGEFQFRTANATDRLFVVGNAIDSDNDNNVDITERSDALIILKNGLTRLPSTTNAMITAADGKAVVTKEFLISSGSGGTLDQAYDFGGSGLGKIITADAGAVLINGTDGLVSTGTVGSGALAPSGAGTRMVWNPRKAAFRAGLTIGNQWDDINVGERSVAFGNSTIASGRTSTAFGASTIASGVGSTTFGFNSTASSFVETVFGIGATTYTPSLNGDSLFRTANATDRLFVVGNAIDSDNDNNVDATERSDALIILKNGLIRLPSTTNAMITAADGKAVVTKEFLISGSFGGTLDQAYDFGGAGLGKTITADAGAVLINGIDGLVSTGTLNSGAFAPTGAGVKMFWNPRKAAFRSGSSSLTGWDDANIGNNSSAFGRNTIASGTGSTAFGSSTTASGGTSTAFGINSTASGTNAMAFGTATTADGEFSTAFGVNSTASGNQSIAFGNNAEASGLNNAIAFGTNTISSGSFATSFGTACIAAGNNSTAFGRSNTALTYGETVLGIGATSYTPTSNGESFFRASNATDRLFVIGNAIDLNSDSSVDAIERSNAMTILKNGNVSLGNIVPGGQFELSLNQGRKPTSNTWIIPSDARLKTVHGPYEKGLAAILQLQPVRYNYKNTDKKTFEAEVLSKEAYGFLAQQVKPIFPETVGIDADGYLHFDLHPILIASVNAFKELNKKNEVLQLENEALKTQLEAQSKIINDILQRLTNLENKK